MPKDKGIKDIIKCLKNKYQEHYISDVIKANTFSEYTFNINQRVKRWEGMAAKRR